MNRAAGVVQQNLQERSATQTNHERNQICSSHRHRKNRGLLGSRSMFCYNTFFFFLQRKLQWVRCTERVECCQKRTEHARGHRTLAPGEGEYSFGGALALLLVRDVTETQGIQPIAIALAVT